MELFLPADCHPMIRALYDYWAGRRGGRAMPGRVDLDPIDVPALLPYVFMVDTPPSGPMTYRVFGTALVALFGRELTGRPVGEGAQPEHAPEVLARYARIVAERRPFYHRARLFEQSNDFTDIERVILPLSADGIEVDQLIGMTIPRAAPLGRR
ncbi:MAG: PAS domain-containing protein [Alphaproteobacteria bacterium]|nr:PAS domain-containing protein [Alphaproteobacteria bacterium]